MSKEVTTAEPQLDLSLEERMETHRQERLKLALELGGDAVRYYFHGTNYPFKPGDQITPQGQAIEDKNGVRHASASWHEDGAWFYAEGKEALEGGRGRVYKVIPSDGKLAEQLGPQHGEVNSRAFTVVEQIDVKPGLQGTLPDINWNKHLPYVAQNHPQDPPYTVSDEWQEPERIHRDEMPLPGLGDEYVRSERERRRKESGAPQV